MRSGASGACSSSLSVWICIFEVLFLSHAVSFYVALVGKCLKMQFLAEVFRGPLVASKEATYSYITFCLSYIMFGS